MNIIAANVHRIRDEMIEGVGLINNLLSNPSAVVEIPLTIYCTLDLKWHRVNSLQLSAFHGILFFILPI